jgi:hypothetical protein
LGPWGLMGAGAASAVTVRAVVDGGLLRHPVRDDR